MTARIVVVGSFNTDLTAYTERLPRPGETVNGERFVVQDPDHPTGVAPIVVDAGGENSIVVVLGANLALSRADVDAAREAIAAADVVITQLEIDYDVCGYALEVAKEHGVATILNPAPAGQLPPGTVALADYITPNETELQVLSGLPDASVEEAARSLLVRDGQTVVTTLGIEGARYVQRESTAAVPCFRVDAVDTTGAGDAFNGGFAVALAEGRELRDALRFANATAALAVTKPGTAPAMPTRAEVETLLASQR